MQKMSGFLRGKGTRIGADRQRLGKQNNRWEKRDLLQTGYNDPEEKADGSVLLLLHGDPEGEELLKELASAWAHGDEQALNDLLDDDTAGLTAEEMVLYEEYNNAMITDRNERMTDFAENALIDGNELFICVGAAHVIGDDGMAQQLRERGYRVEIVH